MPPPGKGPLHLRRKQRGRLRSQLQVGKKRTGLSRNVSRGISRGTSSTPRFSPSKYRRYCQKRKECYNNHCARCGGVRQETQSHLNQMSLSPAHKNGRYIMNYITRNGDRGKMEIDTFLGRVGAYPGMDTGSEEFSALIRRYQEAHAHLGLVVDGYVNPEYRGGLFDKVLAGETADWKSGASIGVMTQPPPPVLMSEAEVGSGDTSSSVPTSGSGQTSFPPYSSSSVPSTPRPFDPNIFIRPDGRGNPATSTVPGYTPGSPFGSPFSPNVPSGPSQPSPPSGGSTYFPRPDGRGTFTPSTISPSQTPRFSRQPVPNITPTPQTPRIFTQPPATTQPPLTNQPPRNIQRIPIPNTVPPSTYPPPTTYNQPPQPPQTYTPPRQQVQPRNQPSYQPPTPTGPSPEELRRQQQILARQAEAERLQRQRDLQRQQALAQQRQQQQEREAAQRAEAQRRKATEHQNQGPTRAQKISQALERDRSNISNGRFASALQQGINNGDWSELDGNIWAKKHHGKRPQVNTSSIKIEQKNGCNVVSGTISCSHFGMIAGTVMSKAKPKILSSVRRGGLQPTITTSGSNMFLRITNPDPTKSISEILGR